MEIITGKKLKRFAEIKEMPNVLEHHQSHLAGKWQDVFHNSHPIHLELACGKGEYTIELARRFPNENFIGIDIKGNRIWVGAKQALDEGLSNVRFLRIPILSVKNYFAENEIKNIWIVYPDPFIRLSKQKNRLTYPTFLNLYQSICSQESQLFLKTDSPLLYRFTIDVIRHFQLQLIQCSENSYAEINDKSHPIFIPTHYEKMDIAKSKKVFFIHFCFGENEYLTKNYRQKEILNQLKENEKMATRTG